MANLSETATFDSGVYQLETTDPVLGGASGVSNAPLKNLANRTKYLKEHIDAVESGTGIPTSIARVDSQEFTGDPKCPTRSFGDNDTSLANTAFVQATVSGVLSLSVAGNSDVTLSAIQAGVGILEFTGALTGNISVNVPTSPTKSWIVFNNTSGAYTLAIKTSAGTGILIPQGSRDFVYCDGTNVVQVHAGGLQTLWIPSGAMVARTTNGPALGTLEMATTYNMFKTLDFDTATSEYAQFFVQMPKSWNRGTVTAAFVWSHASTTTNFGVAFGLQGVACSNDDTGAVAFGTGVVAVDTGGTTNDIYVSPVTGPITIAGSPAANDYVQFQVYRSVSDAGDTMAIDARLHGLQLFFTTNAPTDA